MTTPATTQPTTAPVDNTLVQTREALHAVAEHVLAAVRYRDAGRIGLTVTPGGFSTPLSGTGGRAVGIDGVALRAADINYGASPGDEYVTMPYLYVGPPSPPPPSADGFWNAAFGAYLTWNSVSSVADAVAFFRTGRRKALGA
jgi:hypothetical protein